MTTADGRLRFLSAALGIVLCLAPGARSLDQETELAIELLGQRGNRGTVAEQRDSLLKELSSDPERRSRVIRSLIEHFRERGLWARGESSAAGRRISTGHLTAARRVKAVECVPTLVAIWARMTKEVTMLERGDRRIQLLITLSELMEEERKLALLIGAMDDEDEDPTVRFRALVLLCASGHPRAIDHVKRSYAKDCRDHGRKLTPEDRLARAEAPKSQDADGDGLRDAYERDMCLDPRNLDTDGDGLPDGSDRNPLSKPADKATAASQQASFIAYVFAKYLQFYARSDVTDAMRAAPNGPYPFKVFVLAATDSHANETPRPSIFDRVEILGGCGVFLALNREQLALFRKRDGHGRIRVLHVHRMSTDELRSRGLETAGHETASFALRQRPMHGHGHGSLVCLKRFGDVWLPVSWEMTWIE